MNVKGINPFERHVEKIVLAVAAAGALYLGWLALQPVQIVPEDGGEPIAINNIESDVAKSLDQLAQKRDASRNVNLKLNIPDFVRDYNQVANQSPLNAALVSAAVPHFAPLQAPITPGAAQAVNTFAVVTPTAPDPIDLVATAHREVVLVQAPGQAAAPIGQPPVGARKDMAWVEIDGAIPLADLVKAMSNPALKANQRLPQNLQRAVVVKVEVQRRPQRGDGTWGDWQNAPASAASKPLTLPDWSKLSDAEVMQAVAAIEQNNKQVLQPDYYSNAPTPAPSAGMPPAGGGGPADPTIMAPQVDDQLGGFGPQQPQPQQPQNRPGVNLNPAAMAQLAAVPFKFFDDSMEAGHIYQYQVRVLYYNPTYRFKQGLATPAMQSEPLIASNWVPVPQAVNVRGDLYFFVTAPLGSSGVIPKAGVRVFKWTGGQWYRGEWTVQAGQAVAGSIPLVDKRTSMDVDTPYTVVDVIPGPNGREQDVILRGPKGELIQRNSKADLADPELKNLEDSAVKPPVTAPPTTRPAIRPPVTPRGGNQTPAGGFHDDQL